MIKKNKLSVIEQLASLKKEYSFGKTTMLCRNKIKWEGYLKSSPLGDEYLVRLIYKLNDVPQVFVLEPIPLELPEEESRLKHVYNQDKQELCLYYPKAKEWTSSQYISHTIMPWAIEWLYHYEIWLMTGEWTGGGIVHTSDKR
ncbi:hypothetical protein NK356_06125 [Chryseobacterium sp. S0630]|uniref:hypothetical protein n=1 Tax=Chryseobacterium sp. S0630 TaxID=2957803 RepID=UPI0020A0EC05|nr:hypothetical protein [Chryseobacterium sp. S0630]MCP1298735.1 hypothetical protein [Chryseobacterium sp. S0630]